MGLKDFLAEPLKKKGYVQQGEQWVKEETYELFIEGKYKKRFFEKPTIYCAPHIPEDCVHKPTYELTIDGLRTPTQEYCFEKKLLEYVLQARVGEVSRQEFVSEVFELMKPPLPARDDPLCVLSRLSCLQTIEGYCHWLYDSCLHDKTSQQ